MELINFQVPIYKSDCNKYYARTFFALPGKLEETNIWMFLEY